MIRKAAHTTLFAMLLTACGAETGPAAATVPAAAEQSAQTATAEPARYTIKVIATYPHDENAFTQGLFYHQGYMYESTGQYGQSSVRKTDLETGEVLTKRPIADRYFGEGSVVWEDRVISLTWHAGKGFIHSLGTLEPLDTFSYPGQGWGLTASDAHLIMSDGSSNLRFLNPETLTEEKRISVTLQGQPLRQLNELEYINGEVFANIWLTDYIVRINPNNGVVTGIINLTGLLPEEERRPGHTDVLNGIAWDAENERLFVTGKNWPTLYEIELIAN